jgi:hypothetical protein
MIDLAARIESISPSKYERLKSCALQVFFEQNVQRIGVKSTVSKSQITGLVFHKAFELYLTNTDLDSDRAWNLAVVSISREYGVEIHGSEVRRPKLFFEKRLTEVLGLLEASNAKRGTDSVKSEFRCSSNDGVISGVIDLFIDSEIPVIVDFKTGIDSELQTISPSISRQLSLYASIIRDIRGYSPKVYVVGMKSGPREIHDIDIDSVVVEVRDLVSDFNNGSRTTASNVSVVSCTYCRQIGKCEEVWKQNAVAKQLGCIAGLLNSVLIARNGMAHVQIVLDAGSLVSVRDVPSNKVESLTKGARLKMWGLKSLSVDANSYSWVTNRSFINNVKE